MVPGAAQKNQLSRDQLHRPGWLQGALSRAGSPTSPCQLLWGAAFKAPWQNSQVSGQGGTLSDKLSFWRGMRLNPVSAVCLKEAQASHLAANYSIALGFELLVFFLLFLSSVFLYLVGFTVALLGLAEIHISSFVNMGGWLSHFRSSGRVRVPPPWVISSTSEQTVEIFS